MLPVTLHSYLVLDVAVCGGAAAAITVLEPLAAEGLVTMVQLRDKRGSDAQVVDLAKQMQATLRPRSIPLLLNDRWHLVQACGADGVHLGQDDGDLAQVREALGTQAIIGRSIDHPREWQAGHDYHGIGPIFSTSHKGDAGPVVGCARLAQWRSEIPGPLVAIGGITVDNAQQVMETGVDGVAVLGAICAAADPTSAARRLQHALRRAHT
ncbi:MAG: thiamine phosphate synthase [Planctomycetota bacterium]|nr:MAG: thiamine phosphate synthase [Planctomycetota bacterium]